MPGAGAVTAHLKEDNALSLSTTAETTATNGAQAMKAPQSVTSESLLAAVLKSLEDDKGEDIVQINLRGKSEIGDFMVIASGRSTRQVTAMAEKLADRLKQDFGILCKTEGKDAGDWVLIDTGDIIVHIFRPEVREFYQLEKMWQPGAAATP
ncbi:ribosome silencing factor [Yoonia sp. BS5-3]|uniref:Ribosomal silencing factor RsfS n=1 Tax=Yoonia phaeophyticola TaxID=3137369 RepID=A0ABZ2V7Z4_9RHOB